MGVKFLKAAVIYYLIGVVLGLVMGSVQAFQYTSVHAHINLLGWASLALCGTVYTLFPKAGTAKLARIHFILHNVGLPLLVISMVLFANGLESAGIPFAIVGGLLVIVSVILFTINVFKRVQSDG